LSNEGPSLLPTRRYHLPAYATARQQSYTIKLITRNHQNKTIKTNHQKQQHPNKLIKAILSKQNQQKERPQSNTSIINEPTTTTLSFS